MGEKDKGNEEKNNTAKMKSFREVTEEEKKKISGEINTGAKETAETNGDLSGEEMTAEVHPAMSKEKKFSLGKMGLEALDKFDAWLDKWAEQKIKEKEAEGGLQNNGIRENAADFFYGFALKEQSHFSSRGNVGSYLRGTLMFLEGVPRSICQFEYAPDELCQELIESPKALWQMVTSKEENTYHMNATMAGVELGLFTSVLGGAAGEARIAGEAGGEISIAGELGSTEEEAAAFAELGMTESELKCANELAETLECITNDLCFSAGTKVLTEKGPVEIEKIQEGDFVRCENEETGEQALKRIEKKIVKESNILYHVMVGDEEIQTTLHHPFRIEGKGWVKAECLTIGDKVRLESRQYKQISNIWMEKKAEPIKVYNLSVEDYHTYYVSGHGVLVHNAKCSRGNVNILENIGESVSNSNKLLPKEGDIGTYKELRDAGEVGDNITPHHMPSAEYMSSKGVSKNDGLCMNMEMPSPGTGGRHRMTDTYGRNMTDAQKAYYYSLPPRDALVYDINNLRQVYMSQGLYSEMRPKLQAYIKAYKEYMPELFNK